MGRQTIPDVQKWGLDAHTALHARVFLAAVPGARVTSGRRTPERNRAVGGVPSSFHLRGRAIDVVVPAGARQKAIRTAWRQRVTPHCTGPEEVIDEGDHIHIAW